MFDQRIKSALDEAFLEYGRVLEDFNPVEFEKFMKTIPIQEGIDYVASCKELEALEMAKYFEVEVFGEMPVQIGYVCGHNSTLDAVEYHKSPEVLIAITDLLLILGKKHDIGNDYTYDTSLMEVFIVPAGIAVELATTTLHYCPCNSDHKGFQSIAVMTLGSNTELEQEHSKEGEDQLLFAVNKWLIAHPESEMAKQGAFLGIKKKVTC
jgi:hypothetical protein